MSKEEQSAAEQREKQRLAERREDFQLWMQGPLAARCLEHLAEHFETRLPAYRTPELAEHPDANCHTMAAIRDGQREVVEWLKDQAR